MIRYTQIITIPQDEPFMKKAKGNLLEEDGWVVSETTVEATFERTAFINIEDEEKWSKFWEKQNDRRRTERYSFPKGNRVSSVC